MDRSNISVRAFENLRLYYRHTTTAEGKIMGTYNGWTNYPTWNINLWIGSDSGSFDYWTEQSREAWESAEPSQYLTKSQSAKYALANRLEDEFEELRLDNNGESGPMTDILTWALDQVDWDEIADHWLADNVEEYDAKS